MDNGSSKGGQKTNVRWLQILVTVLVGFMGTIAIGLAGLGVWLAIQPGISLGPLDLSQVADNVKLDLFRSAGATLQGISGIGLAVTAYVAIENLKGAEESRRLEAEKAEESRKAAEETRKATEEKQVTDLFVKATEMLADDRMEVRIGGIYALERISKNSQKDYGVIMEVLAGFIRSRETEESEDLDRDIQAAITVIARRNPQTDPDIAINLKGSNLMGVSAYEGNFQGVNFDSSNMVRASLIDCRFDGACLTFANLQFSHLDGCNFTGAKLFCADLQLTSLRGAQLAGADLYQADLRDSALEPDELLLADNWMNAKYSLFWTMSLAKHKGFLSVLYEYEPAMFDLVEGLLGGFKESNRDELFLRLLEELQLNPASPEATSLENALHECFESGATSELTRLVEMWRRPRSVRYLE